MLTYTIHAKSDDTSHEAIQICLEKIDIEKSFGGHITKIDTEQHGDVHAVIQLDMTQTPLQKHDDTQPQPHECREILESLLVNMCSQHGTCISCCDNVL